MQSVPDSLRALAVLLLGAAVASCDAAPARSKPWRYQREPEVKGSSSPLLEAQSERVEARRERGHTLRIHLDADPDHLNPMVRPTEWAQRIAMGTVFESLLTYRPGAGGGPGRYRPALARSWKVSPDGREIRIDLRPDVHFHDGRRMTSVDVQFSLDTARHPRRGAEHLRAHLRDVSSVGILGPRRVRIRLARENAYVLRALAQVPILPERVYEGRLAADRGAPLVGTGPYRFDSWEAGEIRLSRNDAYWGEPPAIRDVVFVRERDAARAITAAKEGALDLVPALIAAHYPEQASAPGIAGEFSPLRLRPPVFRYLALNTSQSPLDDARVRRAIALLIDPSELAEEAHDGFARAVAGPVWPGGPGDGAAPAPAGFDPARAAARLAEAGWRDGDGDGVRERDGEGGRLLLTALATEEESAEREAVIAALERFGFVVDLRVGPSAVLLNRMRKGAFDLAFLEWRGAVDRDLTPLLGSGGGMNFGGFSDPRVDRTLAALRGAWTPAERAPLLANLAGLVGETLPVIPLPAPDPYGLLHERVRGAVVWDGWLSIPELSLSGAEAGD